MEDRVKKTNGWRKKTRTLRNGDIIPKNDQDFGVSTAPSQDVEQRF